MVFIYFFDKKNRENKNKVYYKWMNISPGIACWILNCLYGSKSIVIDYPY